MAIPGRKKSRLADELEQALIEQSRRMLPEQRLQAFVEHSRLMVQFMLAGRRARARSPRSAS